MTTAYFLKSGLKFSSVPWGFVVATSTVNSPVSSRYFFIILVVVGQTPWLFWPSTISALSGSAEAVAARLNVTSRASTKMRDISAPSSGERLVELYRSLTALPPRRKLSGAEQASFRHLCRCLRDAAAATKIRSFHGPRCLGGWYLC